jgi:hypothetical protein
MKDYIEVQLMKKIQDLMIDVYRHAAYTTHRISCLIAKSVNRISIAISAPISLSYMKKKSPYTMTHCQIWII